ncbi:MAG: hypothetical protein PHO63_00030 [Bacilli bacterium]|nr:hypothetical protein [Bacilli bacterium]MDD4809088.1 hypothetical protein [Bacilli bacterium]
MLDEYQSIQPVVYKMLKNSLKNNRNSHAYLFETKENDQGLEMAIAFSKYLLCPFSYSNDNNCNDCKQCETINNNNFTEIKIINPDGMWIKKEQLIELQNEFSKKAVMSDKKIYIINNAERLNTSAANSILKFLEEPENNIIAILVTSNQYLLLDTIVSRCQVISFIDHIKFEGDNTFQKISKLVLNQDECDLLDNDQLNNILKFVDFYEENKKTTLLYTNRMWHRYITNRRMMEIFFDVIILYYKDVLNYKCGRKIENFNDYLDNIKSINDQNDINSICYKIKVYLELKDKIKFNVNNHLLVDKLIIMLEGGVK